MSYRRKTYFRDYYTPSTTRVSVHWSAKSSAYSVLFSDKKHWNEMQVLINFIKGLNVGEKDCQMDDSSGKKIWTWYFAEQHLDAFKALVDSFAVNDVNSTFDWDFTGKPSGQTNQSVFIPNDVYLNRFRDLTGQDIKDKEFREAKKIYHRWLMVNHPDKGGDHNTVRDVNECWSNLEVKYFNAKKETEYVYE
jgi:hypothetical protein